MEDIYTITDLEQVRLLADPLRLQILEHFCQEPRTTKQVAELLGEKPTRLYHHVDGLERVGLIKLVKTRKKRGTLEKYYEGVAKQIRVDQSIFEKAPRPWEADQELLELVASPLRAALSEIREGIRRGSINRESVRQTAIVGRMRIRTTAARLKKLSLKIEGWLADCETADQAEGDLTFGLTLAFYPIESEESKKKSKYVEQK